jgi:hypothetical protein
MGDRSRAGVLAMKEDETTKPKEKNIENRKLKQAS